MWKDYVFLTIFWLSPPIAATTSSGTLSLAREVIAFAAANFISSLIVVALTSKAPLKYMEIQSSYLLD